MYPFLSNLGISVVDQANGPTADAFPPAFNVNAKRIWDEVLRNFTPSTNKINDWGNVIRTFVRLAEDQEVYPFSNVKQSANDQIFHHLMNARREVVKFMNKSRILTYVSLRVSRRTVRMLPTGFAIQVMATATLKDPTFEAWLLELPTPNFNLKHDGVYTKQLTPLIDFIVFNEGKQRWRVGYEIRCNQFPSIPGNSVPTKQALEKFVADILWAPVLRHHRPDGFHHRLI